MAITKVKSGVRTLGTGEVATANMAVDPTNASNLTSGSVPLAQLGNVDTTTLEDDIALLGFKVAANGSFGKYNLVDQTQDAFMDATGIDASASTGETRNAANYYSGVGISTPTASGGTVTTVGLYTIHSFLSGSTSYTNNTAQDTDILIVAGAGGAGGHDGGGSGAGGVRVLAAQSIGTGGATVVVGGGGAGNPYQSQQGVDGDNSSVAISGGSTLTATGGGGGGGENSNGRTGGSGGGGGQGSTSGAAGNSGSYSPVEGYGGGAGSSAAHGYGGGGGGGAGEAGDSADGSGNNGHGGDGIQNNYRTGSNVYYGGGGGGAGRQNPGNGGQGGGGAGKASGGGAGNAGSVNTGGGGGGGADGNNAGGAGGSGIVVFKRLTEVGVASNMVLQSNATTAETTATKGDIVMTYTNGAGTATLNTDLTAEFSADNGSNWTSMTLEAQGTTGSASPHIIVTAHNVTAGVSGTEMKYRIKTFDQSAAKDTRIQAVSLGWS